MCLDENWEMLELIEKTARALHSTPCTILGFHSFNYGYGMVELLGFGYKMNFWRLF